MRILKLLFTILILIYFSLVFAQEKDRIKELEKFKPDLSEVKTGTTGKIKGIILDENGDPLPGAEVVVVGTTFGAETDEDGFYYINGLRAGTYTLKAQYLGYAPKEAIDVKVRVGLTTTQDFKLWDGGESEGFLDHYYYPQNYSYSNKYLYSDFNATTQNQYSVNNTVLSKVLSSEAVELNPDPSGNFHLRGGCSDDTKVFLNGINTNLNIDNISSTSNKNMNSYLISGVPSSDIGNMLSGYIDHKSTNGVKYLFRLSADEPDLNLIENDIVLSGNIPITPKNKFDYSITTNYLTKSNHNNCYPDEKYDITGIGFDVDKKEINRFDLFFDYGLGMFINPLFEIRGTLFNSTLNYCTPYYESENTNVKYGIDSLPRFQKINNALFHDIMIRYTINQKSFIHTDYSYSMIKKKILDRSNIMSSSFVNSSNEITTSYTKQYNRSLMYKIGFDLNFNKIDADTNTFSPLDLAYFLQIDYEFEDLKIFSGLRLDSRNYDDNTITHFKELSDEYGLKYYEIKKNISTVSPRFGINHSVSETSFVYFAYGLMTQFPELEKIYTKNGYDVYRNDLVKIVPNNNLDLEKNTMYDFGLFTRPISGKTYLISSLFYKDMKDLITVKKVETTDGISIYRYTNLGSAYSYGFDLHFSNYPACYYENDPSLFFELNYSLSFTKGNLNDLQNENYYMDWDQRHKLYFSLKYDTHDKDIFSIPFTDRLNIKLSNSLKSGLPFTPTIEYYNGMIPENKITMNSERMPWTSSTDITVLKSFEIGNSDSRNSNPAPGNLIFEFEINNIFNNVNVNSVYPHSGSYYLKSDENYNYPIMKNNGSIFQRRNFKFTISYQIGTASMNDIFKTFDTL